MPRKIEKICGPINLPSRGGKHIPPKGKRKIIFKMAFLGDMLVPRRVSQQSSLEDQLGMFTRKVEKIPDT